MNSTTRYISLPRHRAWLALMLALSLSVLFSPALHAQEQERGVVTGIIETVEVSQRRVVIEGLHYNVASPVIFDGVKIDAEKALRLLSAGDSVRLYERRPGSRMIDRIGTRLR